MNVWKDGCVFFILFIRMVRWYVESIVLLTATMCVLLLVYFIHLFAVILVSKANNVKLKNSNVKHCRTRSNTRWKENVFWANEWNKHKKDDIEKAWNGYENEIRCGRQVESLIRELNWATWIVSRTTSRN